MLDAMYHSQILDQVLQAKKAKPERTEPVPLGQGRARQVLDSGNSLAVGHSLFKPQWEERLQNRTKAGPVRGAVEMPNTSAHFGA